MQPENVKIRKKQSPAFIQNVSVCLSLGHTSRGLVSTAPVNKHVRCIYYAQPCCFTLQ